MRFLIKREYNDVALVIESPTEGYDIGVFLQRDGVDGWNSTPAPREDPISRTLTDGNYFPNTITQGSRTVTIRGVGFFESSIEAARFCDKVCSLVGKVLILVCEDANGSRMCDCYISDAPSFTLKEADTVVLFTLIFTCPDPHKYGAPVHFASSGNRCIVRNEGNAPTYPEIEVHSRITRLNVSLNGQSVKWSGNANYLYMNFRDMSVSSGKITVDNCFEIPPGKSELDIDADAPVEVIVSPAWR